MSVGRRADGLEPTAKRRVPAWAEFGLQLKIVRIVTRRFRRETRRGTRPVDAGQDGEKTFAPEGTMR
ncbi:unnamed protein product [Parajaminaea phylloscopi]